MFVGLTVSRKHPMLRLLFVIVLTSVFFLAGCKSTASVQMMNNDDAPTDAATGANAGIASDGEALFVVRGELPLSTSDVNALILFINKTLVVRSCALR